MQHSSTDLVEDFMAVCMESNIQLEINEKALFLVEHFKEGDSYTN